MAAGDLPAVPGEVEAVMDVGPAKKETEADNTPTYDAREREAVSAPKRDVARRMSCITAAHSSHYQRYEAGEGSCVCENNVSSYFSRL